MAISRAAEDHHHSADDVEGYVKEALRIADEYELTDAVRASLVPTIVTLLSSKQVWYQEIGTLPAMTIPRNARH